MTSATRKRSRADSGPSDDLSDLSVPEFLLVKNRTASKSAGAGGTAPVAQPPVDDWRRALDALEPPEFREFLEHSIRRGHFERSWLVPDSQRRTEKDVAGIVESFRGKFSERLEKQERSRERLRELSANRPKKINPLAGLIPLRQILEEMGDKAPRRRHAMEAIEAAKMEHTKFHFPNSVVTLARVKQVLASYVPPTAEHGRKPRPEFPADAVIEFEGENPKKDGSDAYARWALLKSHHRKTVGEFLGASGNPVTLQNAILQKRVTLRESKMKKGR